MRSLNTTLALLLWLAGSGVAQQPDPHDWAQYNYDNRAWRFNTAEKSLSTETAGQLVEKWRFPARGSSKKVGAIHATPIVVNGFVYAASAKEGVLYKLSPAGKLVWEFKVPPQPIKFAAVVTEEQPIPSWRPDSSDGKSPTHLW